MPPLAYLTVDALKASLTGLAVDDTSQDARLLELIYEASAYVNDKAGRTFTSTTATRSFDAPASPILVVPDLISVDTLTLADRELTVDTDYELLPYQSVAPAQPGARAIRRLLSGYPTVWDQSIPAYGRSPRKQIIITGDWGYTDVPPLITRFTRKAAIRAWYQEIGQYLPRAGNPQEGEAITPGVLLDEADIKMLEEVYGAPSASGARAGTFSVQTVPPWDVLRV